jgi:subtilisin family serine protease
MRRAVVTSLLLAAALSFSSAAWSQGAVLEPPSNHYFVSTGSWGQAYPDQWGLKRIGFDATPQSAWRLVKKNAEPVVVAIIDTGIDWDHRNIDLENFWHNPKASENKSSEDGEGLIGWNFLDHNDQPWDYDGHGTIVAGIIAGSWKDKEGMAGINPFAKLMVLKAVNNFGHSRASYIAEAIAYAADHGARVINLSLGGNDVSDIMQTAVDYAFGKGAVIVIAAGNSGTDVSKFGITGSDKVITVGATGFDDRRAIFSNYGNISVSAPGLDILSLRARRTDTMMGIEGQVAYKPGDAFVGADRRYYRASGTSFAAPMVSGLASLMIANNPALTNRQVINIIKSTARDVGAPGVDRFTGYGLIDAAAALKAPKDYYLFAGISGVEVVQKAGSQIVRVHGTADANALQSATLQIGVGDDPSTWKTIGPVQKSAGPTDVLGDIPASAFQGSKLWQIRVIVTHGSGATREVRYDLKLG